MVGLHLDYLWTLLEGLWVAVPTAITLLEAPSIFFLDGMDLWEQLKQIAILIGQNKVDI